MKLKKQILLAAAALLVSAPLFAEIRLEKCRESRDTVFSPNYNLIMLTSPSAKAKINGEEVHVYKTGTFGKALTLTEGQNEIEVVVSDKKETRSEKVIVTFLTRPKGDFRRPARPEDKWKDMLMYGKTLKGANIKYGDGDERLGGTKMSFIDEDIPVKIVGQNSRLYRLQVSQNRVVYIEKKQVEFADVTTEVVNSENISVRNAGKTDEIYVGLPKRVVYHSWIDLDPTVLYVDLYGVTKNSNWITHKENLGMVDYVDVRQVEGDVLRLVVKFKYKYSWGYHIQYSGNNLVVSVKHTPSLSLQGMHFSLDAGHAPSAGAMGHSGLMEKDVNLAIVYELKALLEAKGAIVNLIRKGDELVEDRVVAAGNPDLFISVHNNAGGSPFAQLGTSCYYKHICNRDYADCILKRLLELGQNNFGLVGNFNFNLVRMTEYPCMLVEGLFMNSLAEEEKLADPEYIKVFAGKIVAGVEDYLKMVKASLPAPDKKKGRK